MRLSENGRRILVLGLSLVGYGLLASVLLTSGIQGAGGSGGIDAIAYWSAAGRALRGEELYVVDSFQFMAYMYPPPLAQLLAPLSLLPLPVFVWLWRGLELVGLRLATGSWTRAGIAILVFPPVIAEIDAANVHLIMAGVTALAMRGTGAATGPAILIKFASLPLVPMSWVHDRAGLARGAVLAAAIVLASLVLGYGSWVAYRDLLAGAGSPSGWYILLTEIPLGARLAIAMVVGLAAVRWIRLAPLAVTLAYPVLWLHGLSTLVAIAAPVMATAPAGAPEPAPGRALVGVMAPRPRRAPVPVMASDVTADRRVADPREAPVP